MDEPQNRGDGDITQYIIRERGAGRSVCAGHGRHSRAAAERAEIIDYSAGFRPALRREENRAGDAKAFQLQWHGGVGRGAGIDFAAARRSAAERTRVPVGGVHRDGERAADPRRLMRFVRTLDRCDGLRGYYWQTKFWGGDMSDEAMLLPPHGSSVVGGRWRLTKKIGSGSFGDVFVGVDTREEGHQPDVAVKLESSRRKNPHLIYEAKLMQHLEGGVGVPLVHYYGQENGYNVMVLDLLGPSLEELFDECGRRFSMKTTLQLIEMMLCRIEFVHSRFIIHRDIKPHNFLMGRGKLDRLVHIIDFGLAKKYRDSKTLDHIPYKEGKTLTGTARYVSVSTHIGIEQSRRDDMESLGYVFIYFVKGSLPWQSLKSNNKKNKYEKIKEMKISNDPHSLCYSLPKEFENYLSYTRLLRFTERPDYTFCRSLFRDLFFREQFANDFLFDWSPVTRSGASGSMAGGLSQKELRAATQAVVRAPAARRNVSTAAPVFNVNEFVLPNTSRHAAPAAKIRMEEAIYTNDANDD